MPYAASSFWHTLETSIHAPHVTRQRASPARPILPGGVNPVPVTVDGGDPKFERPKVLSLNGRPAWLYAPSGWNVTGTDRTVVHVLRVDLNPGDGPLP